MTIGLPLSDSAHYGLCKSARQSITGMPYNAIKNFWYWLLPVRFLFDETPIIPLCLSICQCSIRTPNSSCSILSLVCNYFPVHPRTHEDEGHFPTAPRRGKPFFLIISFSVKVFLLCFQGLAGEEVKRCNWHEACAGRICLLLKFDYE